MCIAKSDSSPYSDGFRGGEVFAHRVSNKGLTPGKIEQMVNLNVSLP